MKPFGENKRTLNFSFSSYLTIAVQDFLKTVKKKNNLSNEDFF